MVGGRRERREGSQDDKKKVNTGEGALHSCMYMYTVPCD